MMVSRRMLFMPVVAFPLAALCLTSSVAAQSTDETRARAAAAEGHKALLAGDVQRARPKLEFAHAILREPSTAYDLMQAYAVSDELVEAYAIGRGIQKHQAKPSQEKARAEVDKAMRELEKLIPKIVLRIHGAPLSHVTALIDDKRISPAKLDQLQRVNPGKHRVVVRAPDFDPPEWTWEGEGQVEPPRELAVHFREKPKAAPLPNLAEQAPTPMRPTVKLGIGLSSSLAVVSVASGVIAGWSYGGVVDAYSVTSCSLACDDEYRRRAAFLQGFTWTSILSGAATIGLGIGTVIHARNVNRGKEISWTVVPSLNGAVMQGTW